MSARFGLLGGFLGLTALEAVLTTKGSAGRVSGLLGSTAAVFEHLTDPTIPAIPDRAGSSSSPGAATQSSAPLNPAPTTGTVTT